MARRLLVVERNSEIWSVVLADPVVYTVLWLFSDLFQNCYKPYGGVCVVFQLQYLPLSSSRVSRSMDLLLIYSCDYCTIPSYSVIVWGMRTRLDDKFIIILSYRAKVFETNEGKKERKKEKTMT